MTEYEAVIGLEIHVQLSTESKLFCSCRARGFEETSNKNTCPICGGHPGTLPVMNGKAVEYAVKTGLATQCEIHPRSVFARKSYFYPDLPKGYQISQYDAPICKNGSLTIDLADGGTKVIEIERIHIEEDAGKNLHFEGYSVVDLNRAGVPLIEVVSRPDLRSAQEAATYMKMLYAIVTTLEVCDGNLQEGNFRCDANVSVRPRGQKELGTRTEIKNVNSFRFVERAIEYEIARQVEVLRAGEKIRMETRGYDSAADKTVSLRSKEEAHDYRYFPEPDLIPIAVDAKWVEELRRTLPELPREKRNRLVKTFQLRSDDVDTLIASREVSDFFEAVIADWKTDAKKVDVKKAAIALNLLVGEVLRLSKETGKSVTQRLEPVHLRDLVESLDREELSSTSAKTVLGVLWESERGSRPTVAEVIEAQGLKQVSDLAALEPIVDGILAAHPDQVSEFRSGKTKLMGFFVGQAMKQSKGKGNPKLFGELFQKRLYSGQGD